MATSNAAASASSGQAFGFGTPFAEQLDFFLKKLALPSERWDDIQKSAHDRAFIVAGAAKADLLNDLQAAVGKRIADGKGLAAFRAEFADIVKRHGWTGWTGEGTKAGVAWRTRIIYSTNMSTSYAAGRWQQLNDPALLKLRPYWQYKHSDGVMHPRPHHKAWNGITLPYDHPFWKTHFAPNGWLCHCRIIPVDEATYLKALAEGKGVPPEGWDTLDPKTGAPLGIDKGFDYAPGANAHRPLKDFIDGKLIKLDAGIGAAMWETLKPVLLEERANAVGEMVAATIESKTYKGASEIAHVVSVNTAADLAARGISLSDAAIWLRDEEFIHAQRPKKANRDASLPNDVWLDITNYLELATPYWDMVDQNLLYVFEAQDSLGKVAVRINFTQKVRVNGKRANIEANFIRTGGVIQVGDMNAKTSAGANRYELLRN